MKTMKKKIKAFAVIKRGKIGKVGVHLMLADCPYAIFDNSQPLEGKTVPVEITYSLKGKK